MSNQGFITLEAPGRFAPFYRSPPFFQLANPHKGARSAYFRPHLTAAVVAVQDLELGLSHRPTGITSTAMISALVLLFILKGPPFKGGNCPNQSPKKVNSRYLWPLRHLSRVMRRNGLTNQKTITIENIIHKWTQDKEAVFSSQRAAGGLKPTIMQLSSAERAAAACERVKRA